MAFDLTAPSNEPARAPAPTTTAAPASSAAPAPTTPTTDDRSTTFRAVQGGNEMQSGEKLLVEAYAAIWLILFALILMTWRRQKKTDERITHLEAALAKARRDEVRTEGGR